MKPELVFIVLFVALMFAIFSMTRGKKKPVADRATGSPESSPEQSDAPFDVASIRKKRKVYLILFFIAVAADVTFAFTRLPVFYGVHVVAFIALLFPFVIALRQTTNWPEGNIQLAVVAMLFIPVFSILIFALGDGKIYNAIKRIEPTTPQISSLAVFSLVLCPLPFVGLPMAICAVRRIAHSDGRLYGKKCAWVSVVINAAFLAMAIVGIIMGIILSRHAK